MTEERKAFEAWYRSKYRLVYLVWMDEFGEYESESEETAWQAWNQALELAAAKSTAAEYRKQIENDALERAARHFEAMGDGKEMFATTVAFELTAMKG
jgi:hypothetical protein